MDKKYGEDYFKKCGVVCAERMLKWGINTAGGWSMTQVLDTQKVPYVYMIDSAKRMSLDSKYEGLKEHWHRMFDFFDPNFETGTLEIAKRAAAYINSPRCIGVFVDNEISWQKAPLMMPKAALTTPATQPAKIEFSRQLKEKYKEISALNAAWKADYKNWDEFLSRRDFVPTEKSAEPDLLAFEKSYYERYFSVCRNAVKAVNENALYFGCRFAWTNDFCVSVASRFCDVVSFNIYASEISRKCLPEGSEDKPIVIGEFNFGNFEGNPRGGCVPRRTLEGQLRGYEEYTLSALENPSVAGIHWFRWMEQCVSGRSDGENFVTGFVDICDTPVYPMVLTARKLSRNLYNIRLSGSSLTKSGVSGEWRTDQH